MALKDIIARIRGESQTIGIDIGHYSIKLAQIDHLGEARRLTGAGVHVLKDGTIIDGEIKDPGALMEALVALINRTSPDGLRGDVVVGINWTQGVIADRILVKPQEGTDDEEVILFEAGNRSPFDEPDITLDYKILNRDEHTHDLEVLLVAAKNSILSSWAEFYQEAGLKPASMDVDAMALVNMFDVVATEDDRNNVVAILNIGHRKSHITFVKEGRYHSTRTIQSSSVDQYIQNICRHMGVHAEDAGKMLRGEKTEGVDPATLQSSLDFASEELSIGVDLAIQYFQSSENHEILSKVYLSGGGANISGVRTFLASKLDLEVDVLNPVQKIEYDPEIFAGEIPESISNVLSNALGYALRKF